VSTIINLANGQSDLKIDFGYQGVIYGTGKIGDTVFLDSNGDGIQNNGEKGIANQVVTLIHPGGDGVFGTGDDISATTTTDVNGQYLFSGLPASQYQVKVNPINGLLNTTPAIFNVTLANGEINLKEDFGFKGTGSIGDYIWHDVNNDGIQGVGESGLAGVTVQLRYAGQDGLLNTTDDLVMLQTTDSTGKYLFTNLAAGQYQVSVINGIPVTLSPSVQSAQNIGSNASPVINLANGQSDLKIDFGYQGVIYGTGKIGDTVFLDSNGDGIQNNGEKGIANQVVTLIHPGGDGVFGTGDDISATATTDANGQYLFSGLPASAYQVKVNPINGLLNTTPAIFNVTLANGEINLKEDFGFAGGIGKIGDYVWFDQNNDGIQQVGETGIANAVVTLRAAGNDGILGNADDVIRTQTTDAQGKYLFSGLNADRYEVRVEPTSLPAGTTPTVGAQSVGNYSKILDLPAGAEDLKVDFGFNRSGASVGDTVWLDSNSDGIQQPNEIGLSGIEVILQSAGADGKLNTADDIFTKTTTDSKGYYQFGNLNAGQISVGVNPDTLPAGAQFTTPSAKSLNLQANEHRTDVDFGVNATGQIGDLVWIDSNGDGIQNNGEIGVSGVVVTLRSAGLDGILGNADDVIRTQPTDLSGKYLFNGLPPASYQVSIQTPTGLSNTTPQTLNVNLAAGQVDLKEDFGLKGSSWIGDTVWLDQNGDKIQQVGEAGLAGVRLNLYGVGVDGIIGTSDDSLLRSTTTDASGKYLFDGLSGGQYQVKVDSATLPAGLTITLDNNSTKIVLPTGEHRADIDFGYQGLGKIGDTVFLDANGDGTQNNGEIGVANQGVKLTFAGKDGLFNTADDVIENTTTDSAGKYLFNGLPSGNYKVELSNVSNGLSPTTPSLLNVSLGVGQVDLKEDFGLKASGSIGDFVWYDQNNDGIQGVGESGLAGVTVQLRSAGNDGVLGNADDILQTQTTDSAGKYLFTNLAAGQYQVSVINGIPVTLSPSVQSAQNIGSNVSPVINLANGQADLKQDFGYQGVIYGTGKIGDTVWFDQNGDGIQNNGEKGIANQVVTLIHPGGDGVFGTGDDISATTTTDVNGQYLFSGLPASAYQVKANPINGLLNTTPTTLNVNLAAGQIDLKEDFGFAGGIGKIGDYVWFDQNNDGIQGVGESGLAGVTVQLRYAGQDGLLNTTDDLVMLQTTDSAGKYLFTNLAAVNIKSV
jgi:hypothetical protein